MTLGEEAKDIELALGEACVFAGAYPLFALASANARATSQEFNLFQKRAGAEPAGAGARRAESLGDSLARQSLCKGSFRLARAGVGGLAGPPELVPPAGER